jgi:hypothetical protein
MQARGQYNQSGVTATVIPGVSVTMPLSGRLIPVTGLNAAGAQVYGGQNISTSPWLRGSLLPPLLQAQGAACPGPSRDRRGRPP